MMKEYYDWPVHLLVSDVVKNNHSKINRLLSELKHMFSDLTGRCESDHSELHAAESLFSAFTWRLKAHLAKEAITVLSLASRYAKEMMKDRHLRKPGLYSVCQSIDKMYLEHKMENQLFEQLFEQVQKISVESKECFLLEQLCQKLTVLRHELELQVKLENNILFPKIIEMEAFINDN